MQLRRVASDGAARACLVALLALSAAWVLRSPADAQSPSDGSFIRRAETDDAYRFEDVYRVMIVNGKRFKRLMLHETAFCAYRADGTYDCPWDKIQHSDRSVMDDHTTSWLGRLGSNEDANVYLFYTAEGDDLVYPGKDEDIGIRQHLNMERSEIERAGYDWDSIFPTEPGDFYAYNEGRDITCGDLNVCDPSPTRSRPVNPGPTNPALHGAKWPLVVHSSEFDGSGGRFATLAGEEVIVAVDLENQSNSTPTLSAAFTLVDSQGVQRDIEAGRTCGIVIERRLKCAISFYVPYNVEMGEEYQVQWALHGKDLDQRYLAWDYRDNLKIVIAAESCVPHVQYSSTRVPVLSNSSRFIVVNDHELAVDWLTRVTNLIPRPFGGDEEVDEMLFIAEMRWSVSNPCHAPARLNMAAKLEPGIPERPQLASMIGDLRRTALVAKLYQKEWSAAVTAHLRNQGYRGDEQVFGRFNYAGTWNNFCEVESNSEAVCTVTVKLTVGPSLSDWTRWSAA